MPALNNRRWKNVLTTPTKNSSNTMGPPTTPQIRGSAVAVNLTPGSGTTGEQVRPMTSATPAASPQNGSLASRTPSAPPSAYTPSLGSQQQLFITWFTKNVTAGARSRQGSGSASGMDFALLSDDLAVRDSALQNVYVGYFEKGVDIHRKFNEELQRHLRAQQQQKAAHMATQAGAPFTTQANAHSGAAPTIPNTPVILQNGSTQNGNLRHWIPSITEPTKEPSVPPPRRSPRLQATQLANTSGNLPNAGQLRNPTQQPPELLSLEAMQALNYINAMRQTPNMANGFTPLPQKPMPNNVWNSPANPMNLFQGNMPMFPQPAQNGAFQSPQPAQNGAFQQLQNQGYQYINDGLEITGVTQNGMKRKNVTTDDHDEPPRKRIAGPDNPAQQP
ncbi:uncharacterized protein N0V89_006516 [Didymosphaeria variabile]|uniref:Uncharacterized protein n=1 Tax=Didymosphaeria variabile TaxID=1932322 RepID=A0A9W9C9L3_9PLEO|nr:uncharacterized protein N0V89_006516 [Didymosphaeria variabile]KAJ4351177.1 hypothetical protein N0V89_006516 [Didymosphaeria variabile]